MPIDTTVEGDPNSIHTAATWLRTRFQPALHYCGSQVFRASTDAESGWQGNAGIGFQVSMARGGRAIDALYADGGTLGTALDDYADGLHTAQAGMARAREIAQHAGLTLTSNTIEDPGSAPAVLPSALGADHLRQVQAFTEAQDEASRATAIHVRATNALQETLRDLLDHRYEYAADFIDGVAGSMIELQGHVLRDQASHLRAQADQFERNYLHSPAGSDAARLNEQLRNKAALGAEDATSADEGLMARIAGRIPGIGMAIAAGGVGWDIAHGTPPTRTIVTGTVSTGAAMATEAFAFSQLETVAVAVPGLSLLGPVAAGIAAGLAAGALADFAWNQWNQRAPKGTDQAIEECLTLTGHDFIGGAQSAWHALVSVF